MNTGYEMAL